jgi:hypothetical protein
MDHGTSAARARPAYVENKKEHPAAEIRSGVFPAILCYSEP